MRVPCWPADRTKAQIGSTVGPLPGPSVRPKLGPEGELQVPAAVVLGLSVIAFKDFVLFYWRSVSAGSS
jgi:hypothetical protein